VGGRGGVVEQCVLLLMSARIIVFGILSANKGLRGKGEKRDSTFYNEFVKVQGI
jgi:hypothetical protein